MSKFESQIKQVPHPQASVYRMLSDLSNIEQVKDRLPEDKFQDLSFDRLNSFAFSSSLIMKGSLGFPHGSQVLFPLPHICIFEVKTSVSQNLWSGSLISIVPGL